MLFRLRAAMGALVLAWMSFSYAQVESRSVEIVVTGVGEQIRDIATHMAKRHGASAYVILVNRRPDKETTKLYAKIVGVMLAEYEKRELKIVPQSARVDSTIDQRVTCRGTLTGELFLGLELRCGNPSGGAFVGLDILIDDVDYDAVARRVPGWVNDLYQKALKIQ